MRGIGGHQVLLKILHRGFFQFLPAEEQGVGLNSLGSGKLFGDFPAPVFILGMDHSIQVVGPLGDRIPAVAMGNRSESGHFFSHFFYTLLFHLPGNHGIGIISGFLVPERCPEPPNHPPVVKIRQDLQNLGFTDAEIFGNG